MMNGFGQMFGYGWVGMIIGTLFWVGLLAILLWAAFALLSRTSTSGREMPLEILKRRYASGEITPAEFEQASKILQ